MAHVGKAGSALCADLPVRMALGEAHVIALTKASLAEAGVDVAALEASAAQSGKSAVDQPGSDRSSTTLLVKNLPYTATEADILVWTMALAFGLALADTACHQAS